jgi:AcrR family transcriptional regulator
MPRATQVKRKVEEAAIALFGARGVDAVSIADIAAAAGVSQGALYRHYRSKDALAAALFAAAYQRTAQELDRLRSGEHGFAARIGAMVAHFCRLYDEDAALFRFMLLAQHELLPALAGRGASPATVIEATVADAVAAGEIAPVEVGVGAAVVMGTVLQTAVFHLYGRIGGPLLPRAPALAAAAIAGVTALGTGARFEPAALYPSSG